MKLILCHCVGDSLAMKMTAKLGGTNFRLTPGSTMGTGRSGRSWLDTHQPIIFGADLSHNESSGKPSIASIVGSMDRDGLNYEAQLAIQALVEPSQNSPCQYLPLDCFTALADIERDLVAADRAKKSEVIVDMQYLVKVRTCLELCQQVGPG